MKKATKVLVGGALLMGAILGIAFAAVHYPDVLGLMFVYAVCCGIYALVTC